MDALVIGGTGPTGPPIVNGLLARDYRVSILHTGTQEREEIPPEVEHMHTNRFSEASVAEALDPGDQAHYARGSTLKVARLGTRIQ